MEVLHCEAKRVSVGENRKNGETLTKPGENRKNGETMVKQGFQVVPCACVGTIFPAHIGSLEGAVRGSARVFRQGSGRLVQPRADRTRLPVDRDAGPVGEVRARLHFPPPLVGLVDPLPPGLLKSSAIPRSRTRCAYCVSVARRNRPASVNAPTKAQGTATTSTGLPTWVPAPTGMAGQARAE